MDLFSLLYYDTVNIKVYDEVENLLAAHACKNNLCNTTNSIVQKLSNKQSAKVICRFDRLRTSHSKRLTSHMTIGWKTY